MEKPYLSVVVPAFQEEQRIENGLQLIFNYLHRQGYPFEVIVIDDGCTDGTNRILSSFERRESLLRVLHHTQNRGKGAAVQTGMRAATGRYALIADTDNSTPIEEAAKLLAVMGEKDIAIGSRYLTGSQIVKKQPFLRRLMSRGGNLLFHIVLGLRYTDTRCGFKLFSEDARKRIFPLQTLERWGFDTEILVIAGELKLRVAEVPVRWIDSKSNSTVHPFRDSLRSIKEIIDIRRHKRAGDYQNHSSQLHHGT